MSDTFDFDAFQCFLDETVDSFAGLGSKVLRLETEPNSKELLEEIFRPVHSIKGNAGFFELNSLLRISHKLEDLLQDLRLNKLAVTQEVIDILVAGINILTEAVNRIADDPGAKELTKAEKDYLEIITEFRPEEIAGKDITDRIQSLTGLLNELNQREIDPNSLAHADQVVKSLNLLIDDAEKILEKSKPEAFASDASFILKDKDVTEYARHLFEVRNRLADKSAISSELKKSFNSSFYTIFNLLNTAQQKQIKLDQTEPLFGFLDDAYLNQSDDFIKEITEVIEAVVQHLDTSGTRDELKNEGEIPIDKDMVSEKDLAENFKKQKTAGQKLLADDKVREKDLDPDPSEKKSREIDHLQSKEKPAKAVKTIRIQQGKIDEFVFLVGELIMNLDILAYLQKRLAQKRVEEKTVRDLKNLLITIKDVAGEMEKSIMSIRRVPARSVLQKVPAMVRSLSQKVGKPIRTEVINDEVLVDKDLLEKIEDPLVHLVRNSVDHGIESSAAERVSKGKAEHGTISITSMVDNEFFYLNVCDDGKGIDPEKIRASARQKKFLADHELKKLDDQQVIDLIFNPGFSSAKEVSDISGRGVGLDVVKKNVEEVCGLVKVDSQLGRGTDFHIKVPLTKTLVTKEAIFVEDRGLVFAISAEEVDSVVELNPDQLKKDEKQLTAVIQEKVYTLRRLNGRLDSASGGKQNISANNGSSAICGLLLKNRQTGLLVEKILDFSKIVVKELEHNYFENIPMLEGFTIRGDGQVVMVLKLEQVLSAGLAANSY